MKRCVLVIFLFCAAAHAAEAKSVDKNVIAPIPELVPLLKPEIKSKIFVWRWIEPALMAHWLDPEKYVAPEGMNVPALLRVMPPKLESWKTLAGQKAIEARGTSEALQEFRQLIAYFDQPLKSVDMGIAFYKVRRYALDKRTLSSWTAQMPSGPIMAYGTPKLLDRLQSLVREGWAAKFDFSQRIINNASATIEWKEGRRLITRYGSSIFNLNLTASYKITLAPTINYDGTMTLLMRTQNDSVAVTRYGDSLLVEAGATPKTDAYHYFWLLTPRRAPLEKLGVPLK